MKPDPYKLRAYHNPRNIDESLVPDGWRFRYADEIKRPVTICKFWSRACNGWEWSNLKGRDQLATYIVPVA